MKFGVKAEQNKDFGTKKIKLWQGLEWLAPILFLMGGYVYDLRYLLKYGKLLLDSDMAAEMILANILHQSHSILSADWAYSTEIRVFETQWFYRIGLLFSENNWHMARVIGMAVALAVLAGSVFFACYAAGWKQYSVWTAAFTLWPLGFWYCFQTTFGGYYLPYAVFSFLALGFMLLFAKAPTRTKQVLCLVGLALVAFCSGLNGVRQMMVCFAPILLAVILLKNKKYLISGGVGFIANAAGYLVNMKVFAAAYTYDTQSAYVWGDGTGSWLKSLKWFFEAFGYCQNLNSAAFETASGVGLFTANGIAMGCGLVIGFGILASIVYLLMRLKELTEEDRFLTTVSISMLFVIAFTFTYLHGAMQYWQQTMGFGFVLLMTAVKNAKLEMKHGKIALAAGFALLTVISARGTVAASLEQPYRAQIGIEKVVDWLLENTDYTAGLSDFWKSNLVAELSSGKLEMYTVTDLDEPTELYMWLQKNSHMQDFPTEHYFVLCSHDDDMYADTYLVDVLGGSCIYDDNHYSVFAIE